MKFEDIKKLHQKKFREELGHFLIEGEHLVQELEKAAAHDARLHGAEVFVTHEYAGPAGKLPRQVINARQMAQISETRTPQGIAAVAPIFSAPAARAGEKAIYLHEIQDPGNFGTILRTLAWFGGFRCLTSADSVDLFNGKVVRASMGAVFHVPVEFDVALESLPARYQRIACLDLGGRSIAAPEFRDFDCYVFGNEARGLPREQVSALQALPFTIPGTSVIESLNVAASVNISLYELHR